jgi:hypothetical protein
MKRLNQEMKDNIIDIISGFSEKISWKKLIEEIFLRLNVRISRQALNRHIDIQRAFEVKSISIKEKFTRSPPSRTGSVELEKALEKIQRLKSQNEILIAQNQALKEQFIVWSYNAYIKGLDEEMLNKPLPPINRDSSKRQK